MELLEIIGCSFGADAGIYGQRYGSTFYQLEELLNLKTAVVGYVEVFAAVIIDYDKLETHEIFGSNRTFMELK